MKWEEFKKLEINKQVELINSLIKEFGSITKASKELERSDKTVRKHLESLGYRFTDGSYVKSTNIQVNDKTSPVEAVSENKLHIDLTELEQIVNRLVDKRLENLQKTNKAIELELSSKCEGDVKYRSFGVYKIVLDEFTKYADKHSRYSKVELVSQALILLMDYYK